MVSLLDMMYLRSLFWWPRFEVFVPVAKRGIEVVSLVLICWAVKKEVGDSFPG